ncbi:hypothetical protein PTTG_25960 [Puccinia triticina 1-1 BBBD Race 1]|uniref:Proline-rich protein PRCC n=2 Tax=Puccinia triticina TaxID=208348 RepID=A0A180GZU2_PUCT1|nr:uncharacterized protein PtA15_10A661 [Puccinia triticina]OAV97772.1 hypothetical protein PTTG_25960 [Puccinia triticina 1-1 BBBD Race 1]WAQ89237.1 hypothetical protein PtA15_10A661 [Puccinia triticina]WAR59289.1 hypothetical protein PtB15_10B631 [Puccinia triticina]
MGLVDYPSSDDDHEHEPPKTKHTVRIHLPPPATATTTTSNPSQNDLLAKLKLKRKSPSTSGLASLLPPPKRTQPQAQPSSSSSLAFKPKPVAKHAPVEPDPAPPVGQLLDPFGLQPDPTPPVGQLLNPFGLPPPPASSSAPPTNRASPEAPEPRPSLSVSSAPQVADESPPPPGLLDPYPGYWQKSDGSWCAREASDPVWAAFYATHYAATPAGPADRNTSSPSLPKDFFKDAPPSLVAFDAKQAAQSAWENKPKIIDPREEARQQQQANAKPAKHVSTRARGRHQLSALLTDAQANRAELEDRISRGKSNRKAGGAKYGF